jgi:hypothetical protein
MTRSAVGGDCCNDSRISESASGWLTGGTRRVSLLRESGIVLSERHPCTDGPVIRGIPDAGCVVGGLKRTHTRDRKPKTRQTNPRGCGSKVEKTPSERGNGTAIISRFRDVSFRMADVLAGSWRKNREAIIRLAPRGKANTMRPRLSEREQAPAFHSGANSQSRARFGVRRLATALSPRELAGTSGALRTNPILGNVVRCEFFTKRSQIRRNFVLKCCWIMPNARDLRNEIAS